MNKLRLVLAAFILMVAGHSAPAFRSASDLLNPAERARIVDNVQGQFVTTPGGWCGAFELIMRINEVFIFMTNNSELIEQGSLDFGTSLYNERMELERLMFQIQKYRRTQEPRFCPEYHPTYS